MGVVAWMQTGESAGDCSYFNHMLETVRMNRKWERVNRKWVSVSRKWGKAISLGCPPPAMPFLHGSTSSRLHNLHQAVPPTGDQIQMSEPLGGHIFVCSQNISFWKLRKLKMSQQWTSFCKIIAKWWEESLVGKIIAMQVWGPKFRSPAMALHNYNSRIGKRRLWISSWIHCSNKLVESLSFGFSERPDLKE